MDIQSLDYLAGFVKGGCQKTGLKINQPIDWDTHYLG